MKTLGLSLKVTQLEFYNFYVQTKYVDWKELNSWPLGF